MQSHPIPVCVFAKPPLPGRVKTRLAATVGAEGAARLARAFLADTWAAVSTLPWARPILATTERTELGIVAGEVWLQGEGDLGERMERILRRALEAAPFALAIGADSPGLPTSLLEEARAALETADAVLGPSEDGGFYLLGLRREAYERVPGAKAAGSGLLDQLPWSAADTFQRTLERLEARGLRTRVLPAWFDVDRPDDLVRLRALLAAGEIHASETARVLEGIDLAAGQSVSVIVPVLNEEARIARQLRQVLATPGLDEVIVVDGGSTDCTVALARSIPGVRVLSSPRGRAVQMNAGAKAATGEVLLFLHADVELPPDARRWIDRALGEPAVVAGAFRTWTVAEERSWVASCLHLADLRSRYSRLPYGDQAIFVRAAAFRQVDGFPVQPLMEDLELGRRLRRIGAIRTVPANVRVSGRRFLARPLYYTVLVNVFPLLYRLGTPPRLLAALYGNPR